MGHSGLKIKGLAGCVPGENPFRGLPWLGEDTHVPQVTTPCPSSLCSVVTSPLPLTLPLPSSKDTWVVLANPGESPHLKIFNTITPAESLL